jgi:hypothetical protein
MATNTIPSPCPKSNLTRRQALHNAAPAIAAVGALPAVVLAEHASAAVSQSTDTDPGLAKLEAGYKHWQELWAKADALEAFQDAAFDRARARLPEGEPAPEPDPAVAELWRGPSGYALKEARDPPSPVSIPQELLDRYDAFVEEHGRWRDRQPTLDGDPDYEESRAIERRREELWQKSWELRRRLMKIHTSSVRGVMIKLAMAVEAKSLDSIEDAITEENCSYGGEALLPVLAADLRAMTEARS